MSGLLLLGLRIFADIALYAFLGTILIFLWRSLNQNAKTLSSRQVMPLDLLVYSLGVEDHVLHFDQNNIEIGREPDCDCVLEDSTVSSHHARLSYHHSQWWVEDLLSTNGTKLNDETLQTPTVIVNGDTIQCGQIKLNVVI